MRLQVNLYIRQWDGRASLVCVTENGPADCPAYDEEMHFFNRKGQAMCDGTPCRWYLSHDRIMAFANWDYDGTECVADDPLGARGYSLQETIDSFLDIGFRERFRSTVFDADCGFWSSADVENWRELNCSEFPGLIHRPPLDG